MLCIIEKKEIIKYGLILINNNNEFCCVQSFMSLTENRERTLIVYEGTHKLHGKYFEDRGIKHNNNWQKIELNYLKEIK